MEIKFNCSNPSCRQRIDVDSSNAGRSFQCPACNTTLRVPDLNQPSVANDSISSVEIVFKCSNPDCGQRIAVDGSRAGRWLKCPACDRALQVPGKAIESLIPQHSLFEPSKKTVLPTQPIILPPVIVTWQLRFWWLLKGWGVGVALLGVLIAGLHLRSAARLPPHLDAMLDEVYFHGEILSAPVENKAGTALVYVRTVETGVGVFLVDLTSLDRTQIALAKASDSERGGAVKLFGWSPDDRCLAFQPSSKAIKTGTS